MKDAPAGVTSLLKYHYLLIRANIFLLWVSALISLILIVRDVSAASLQTRGLWNNARLAPVAAWLRGYPLYTPSNDGVINGNVYPPLGALAFLPAAALGHPLPALFVGSILSFLMNLCPGIVAAVLLSREVRGGTQDAVLGGILYLGLLRITEGPDTTLFGIHADAPAIALILCGIIFYSKWWDSRKRFDLAASAVCFVSAVWAKQVAIPLPFIFIPLTWFLGGVRSAFVFSRWSILAGCFWLLVLTPVVTDWKTVFYNCWTIPASQPLKGEVTGGSFERLLIVLKQSGFFMQEYWPLYLAVFGAALSLYMLANSSTPNSAAPRYSFTLIATSLIASLALLPISLLGFSKVGGATNTLVYSLQPILLALSMGALGLLAVARRAGARWDFVARSVVGAWLLVLIVAVRPLVGILHYPLEATRAPVEIAYEESKAGNVWFPEFPLSGLLATGRMYHFSNGIFDRFLARRPTPWQQLVRGIPQVPFTMKYLREERTAYAEKMPIYLGLPLDLFSGKDGGVWRQGVVQKINMGTESSIMFPGSPPDPNQKPSSPSVAPLLIYSIILLAIVISLVLWTFRRTRRTTGTYSTKKRVSASRTKD